MTTLFLMRHAKSSWKSNAQYDHQRPLNARGIRDAPTIANHLESQGMLPDLVLSSDSQRTTLTWQHMQSNLSNPIPIQYFKALYHGSFMDIQNQILSLNNPPQKIMVLGHNPGWENTASLLTGRTIDMTTANVVILLHSEHWTDAIRDIGGWELIAHIRPKDLS